VTSASDFPSPFALLIEVVSAFGPAVVVSVAAATRPDRLPQHAAASPIMRLHAESEDTEQVLRWLADRTEPTTNSRAVALNELYADYVAWCGSRDLLARELTRFADEFDNVRNMPELAGKIRKFGQRYYGLRLVAMRLLIGREAG
jgi:hypothetical protein